MTLLSKWTQQFSLEHTIIVTQFVSILSINS